MLQCVAVVDEYLLTFSISSWLATDILPRRMCGSVLQCVAASSSVSQCFAVC